MGVIGLPITPKKWLCASRSLVIAQALAGSEGLIFIIKCTFEDETHHLARRDRRGEQRVEHSLSRWERNRCERRLPSCDALADNSLARQI